MGFVISFSLLHDDVLDEADLRRGRPSAQSVFGNKRAILGGDFILARAWVSLASFFSRGKGGRPRRVVRVGVYGQERHRRHGGVSGGVSASGVDGREPREGGDSSNHHKWN